MPTTNERRVVVGPSSVVCGGRHSSEEAGGAGPASSSAWLDNLLSLPCPHTGSRLQCALASDGQTLCEVQRFKERFTSWLRRTKKTAFYCKTARDNWKQY